MGLFDFLHRPSGKNTQEVIKEVEKMPTMMSIYREDGTQTEVLNVEEAQKFRHSDGSISSLISARVIHVNQGDTIYLDAADPICFEIPEGRYDLAKELITRFTGMYTGIELNEKSYTYLGRAYSEEDIRLQPPTAVVNEQIGKLNEKLLEEITNKRLRESRLLEVRKKEEDARNIYKELGCPERIKIDIQASSLRQLAALCANCSFYFGNEGGARHIAQALEIPSFAIYSPSASKSMWLPANSVLARGISPDDILPPEQQATLTYEERFASITPEKVYDQLTSTLRQLS